MLKHKSGLLLVFLVAVFAASLVYGYFKFFVFHDYIVHAETDCDPEQEACFVYTCDPASGDCTGDPEEDTAYYKLIHKSGEYMPVCNPDEEECSEPHCFAGEPDCEEIACNDDTLAYVDEGITCSDPADFAPADAGDSAEEGDTEEEPGSDSALGSDEATDTASDDPLAGDEATP